MEEVMNEEKKAVSSVGNVYYLDIEKVYRNPLNDEIYKGDSKKDVDALQRDIHANGLDAALTVVKDDEDKYRIVSGHGRYEAITKMYRIGDGLVYNGKKVPFGRIPCVICPSFESVEDEKQKILSANAKKERTSVDYKSAFLTACELYVTKVERNEIDPKEKSELDFFIESTGLSKRTYYNYKGVCESKDKQETQTKVKRVTEVLSDIKKAYALIEPIDMSEYGKTDKGNIKDSLDDLTKLIKSKK